MEWKWPMSEEEIEAYIEAKVEEIRAIFKAEYDFLWRCTVDQTGSQCNGLWALMEKHSK